MSSLSHRDRKVRQRVGKDVYPLRNVAWPQNIPRVVDAVGTQNFSPSLRKQALLVWYHTIEAWDCGKSRSDQTGLHWSASRTPNCKLYMKSQVVHRIISCTPNHKSTQNQYQSLHGTALNHKSHAETQVVHWNTSCTLKHNTGAETVLKTQTLQFTALSKCKRGLFTCGTWLGLSWSFWQ